jgi:hypothetical protein
MRLNASNFERRVLKYDVPVLVLLWCSCRPPTGCWLEVYRDAKRSMAEAIARRPSRLLAGKAYFLKRLQCEYLATLIHERNLTGWPYLLLYRPGCEVEIQRLMGVLKEDQEDVLEWFMGRVVSDTEVAENIGKVWSVMRRCFSHGWTVSWVWGRHAEAIGFKGAGVHAEPLQS